MEKKNREQRRREKFGHAGGATTDPWPQSEANPVFGQADEADEAVPDKPAKPKPKPRTTATSAATPRKTSKPAAKDKDKDKDKD